MWIFPWITNSFIILYYVDSPPPLFALHQSVPRYQRGAPRVVPSRPSMRHSTTWRHASSASASSTMIIQRPLQWPIWTCLWSWDTRCSIASLKLTRKIPAQATMHFQHCGEISPQLRKLRQVPAYPTTSLGLTLPSLFLHHAAFYTRLTSMPYLYSPSFLWHCRMLLQC